MATAPRGAKQPADRMPGATHKPAARLAAEAENADQTVEREFNGATVRVRPFLDWNKDAMTKLNMLDLEGWARAALHPDDVNKFLAAPGTMRDALDFIKSVSRDVGVEMGEYLAS